MEVESNVNLSMREVNCKLGMFTRPDGSVFISQGETAVIVGIYGPIEVKPHKILINKASVETHYCPKSGMPGIADKLCESILHNVCEAALASALYPRSSIVIIIQEMQNCGGIIPCAINACCLALLNAGTDMKFLFASASCGLDDEGNFHLDPDDLFLETAAASFIFVFDSIGKGLIASHTSGSFNLAQYQSALELCKKAAEGIFDFYKSTIKKDLKDKI
ncbi:hypothetical protein PPYR_02166 [Photinus pyralis]|uniref:Exoribonuclease phosphorolytic domain-containing protein n=2 Tax=Photinus pyralis TaxID=7054 RepID=A0A5N4B6K4_PHOPY|nr:exosome complex component RRP46 [Photinus pyralis]KAB0805196.1 hypothetical protein PPYR_02166 [Photinus pyralis]